MYRLVLSIRDVIQGVVLGDRLGVRAYNSTVFVLLLCLFITSSACGYLRGVGYRILWGCSASWDVDYIRFICQGLWTWCT